MNIFEKCKFKGEDGEDLVDLDELTQEMQREAKNSARALGLSIWAMLLAVGATILYFILG